MHALLEVLIVSAFVVQGPRCPDSLIAAAQERGAERAHQYGCTSNCFIPQPLPGRPLPILTVADLLAQVDSLAHRCREGNLDECTRLGRHVGYAPLVRCGASAHVRACTAGSGADCLDLGELYARWPGASRKEKARSAPLRRRGIAILDKGCNADVLADCETLYGKLWPIYEDTARARVEKRLCELGQAGDCVAAADRDGVRGSALGARLLERGCFAARPNGVACWFLAQSYRGGVGVLTDTTKAAALRQRACALDRNACGQCAPYGCVKIEPQPPRPP